MASRGVGETQGKFATVEQVAKFKLRVEAQSRRTNRLFLTLCMVMSVALLSAAVKIRGGDLVIWQTGDDPASSSKFKLVGTTGAGAARAMQLQNVTVSGTAYRLAVSSEVDEATAERVSLTNAGLLGIGISAPVRTLHVKSVMRLEPQGTAPTGAKGELYCNTDGKLFVHEGTAGWREVSLAD